MKHKILHCEICKEDTRHRVKKKYSKRGRGGGHGQKAEYKHCVNCNTRTIKNIRKNLTYTIKSNNNFERGY